MSSIRPVYLALFSLTLLAVIAGSSALMALVGYGRDVLLFTLGVAVGMSLVCALCMELWWLVKERLYAMQKLTMQVASSLQLARVNPQWLLTGIAPERASDSQLELECRRLLDRMHQLLEKAVDEEGRCLHCGGYQMHAEDCCVLGALALYQKGKAKRIPWQEYKKTLGKTTLV